jgi:tRNA-modifying protein YgfZ
MLPKPEPFLWLQPQAPLIIAQGAATLEMLQGQLGANLVTLPENQLQFTAVCNYKGRVLMSCFVGKLADGGCLLLCQDHQEATFLLKHLTPFAQLSQIKLALAPQGALWHDGVDHESLPNKSQQLSAISTPPEGGFHLKLNHSLHCMIASVEALTKFAATTTLKTDNKAAWLQRMILAGLAPIDLKTQGLFTPDQLNYLHHHAVSLDKGCYVGQEIIARLFHLGQSKKHLYQIKCELPEGLPESRVLTIDGKPCGHIICMASLATETIGLAVIKTATANESAYLEQTFGKLQLIPCHNS